LQPWPCCYLVGPPAVRWLISTAVKPRLRSPKLLHSRRAPFQATRNQFYWQWTEAVLLPNHRTC